MIELQHLSLITSIEQYYRQQGYIVERLDIPYKIKIKEHKGIFRKTCKAYKVIYLDLDKSEDNKIIVCIKYKNKKYKIRLNSPEMFILDDCSTGATELMYLDKGTPIEIGIARAIDKVKNRWTLYKIRV